MWAVLNNDPMIIRDKNLYKLGKAESKMTSDFPTLYTKIPHSKLLKVLFELNDSFFDWGLHKYICVKRFAVKRVPKADSAFVVLDIWM